MSNREKVLAIIGAMQCVSDTIQSAATLQPCFDDGDYSFAIDEARNTSRSAVFLAVSWAQGGGTEKEVVMQNARAMLVAVDNLPKKIAHVGANKYLNSARQAAKELETLIE